MDKVRVRGMECSEKQDLPWRAREYKEAFASDSLYWKYLRVQSKGTSITLVANYDVKIVPDNMRIANREVSRCRDWHLNGTIPGHSERHVPAEVRMHYTRWLAHSPL